jgi:phosphotransferase system enzyme I (PtsI)
MSETITQNSEIILQGVPAAPGIAIGQAYLYTKYVPVVEERSLLDGEVAQEIERLRHAVDKANKELDKILSFAQQKLGNAKAKILEAQVMILNDQYLFDSIVNRIRVEKKNAEHVVHSEVDKYRKLMLAASDEYMHERAHDVDDLKNRIIRNLQEEKLISRLEGSPIVVSHTLTPADTVILSRNETLGYATDTGGITSHASLIARSLKLPAVVGLGDATKHVATGDTVVIDGFSGVLVIHPTRERIREYEAKRQRFLEFEAKLADLKDLPAKTLDGKKVELSANVEFEDEIDFVQVQGAQGIGLYRTESLLVSRSVFPSEDEQYENYRRIVDRMYPHTVIMRTFDIGGDKIEPESIREENPFLGWRGIRVCLDRPELFLTQLRAMLRASTRKNLAIMFPMVTDVGEVRRAKEYIQQAKAELKARKVRFDDRLRLGVMIEVPAAALVAGEIAKEADFLSIGTNDLIQYTLAVDRGNSMVSRLYQEFHPAVLRTVKQIIDAAHKQKKWVGMCGEMAANPLATIILLGMGLDEFSVIPAVLPEIKKIIRSVKYTSAQKVMKRALALTTQKDVEAYLTDTICTMCPDVPLPETM